MLFIVMVKWRIEAVNKRKDDCTLKLPLKFLKTPSQPLRDEHTVWGGGGGGGMGDIRLQAGLHF